MNKESKYQILVTMDPSSLSDYTIKTLDDLKIDLLRLNMSHVNISDLEELNLDKGFIENLINMIQELIIEEYTELCEYILKYIKDLKSYVNDYQNQPTELKTKYVGSKTQKSRKVLMDNILSR